MFRPNDISLGIAGVYFRKKMQVAISIAKFYFHRHFNVASTNEQQMNIVSR